MGNETPLEGGNTSSGVVGVGDTVRRPGAAGRAAAGCRSVRSRVAFFQ
jgi:hypothetical protein